MNRYMNNFSKNNNNGSMNDCKLSNVTKDYLCTFYTILDEMIEDMTNQKLNDSISHNFIVQMIPHHRAAIEMSKNILKYTTCIPLQNIAANIIDEQTKSIENMRNILNNCSKVCNCERDLMLYKRKFNMIIQNMFAKMKNAKSTNSINCNFMWEMIPHHCGAVEMSTLTKGFDICPELIPILDAIIKSQCKGIREMNNLLCKSKC